MIAHLSSQRSTLMELLKVLITFRFSIFSLYHDISRHSARVNIFYNIEEGK